eukprot:gnl/TRDRNA2_/TRDRNA2_118939_c0_seq1.p1 gnl/TRDRNA2_/TRDRNA2_118939_c0~~gnl/TRDRNA2_/TRDRNA2_118939_c0_seq1.p1  ORF type:complete len:301 (+),score=57.89 gnl/TRDRNA2_/TRDRNA2_118939_c0_seq1:80-982(+)
MNHDAAFGAATVLCCPTVMMFWRHQSQLLQCDESAKRMLYRFISAMPVTFAIGSLIIVLLPQAAVVFEWALKVIESLALYRFSVLIIELAGGKQALLNATSKQPPQKYFAMPPLACCFRPCWPNTHFDARSLSLCTKFAGQFMLVSPALFVIVVLEYIAHGGIHGGTVPLNVLHAARNVAVLSTMVAVYGLVVLFHAVHEEEEVRNGRVIVKFVSMKLLVLCAVLNERFAVKISGMLSNAENFDDEAVASMASSLLMLAECPFIAALAACAFDPSELRSPDPNGLGDNLVPTSATAAERP